MKIDVGHDPFAFGCHLENAGMAPGLPKSLLHIVDFWFSKVAKVIEAVKPQLNIECCVGDITTVLEQIRIGAVGHRKLVVHNIEQQGDMAEPAARGKDSNAPSKEPRQEQIHHADDFPKAYDRIHLSNIPDYIGGSFAIFIYAIPVLHHGKSSYAAANCLRNLPRFKSWEAFSHEYLAGFSSPSDLAKAFHVRRKVKAPDLFDMLMAQSGMGGMGEIGDYVKWN